MMVLFAVATSLAHRSDAAIATGISFLSHSYPFVSSADSPGISPEPEARAMVIIGQFREDAKRPTQKLKTFHLAFLLPPATWPRFWARSDTGVSSAVRSTALRD